jgi:CTP synthase (UTP-ammonia lyase)
MGALKVGIVGDFDRGKHSHWATEAGLFHAAAQLGISVEPRWVPTSTLAVRDDTQSLERFAALWGAPGSPFDSMSGMLNAIEYARTRNVPYLGTCAGFQYALIEFSRNVLGVSDADSAENAPDGKNIVITPVDCALPARGPRLNGISAVRPMPGSALAELCGPADLAGEFFCNFETNRDFIPRWEAAGLRVAACSPEGEMRAFELPDNRFFLATLFQPQLSSSHQRPHPIVTGFLKAASLQQDHS